MYNINIDNNSRYRMVPSRKKNLLKFNKGISHFVSVEELYPNESLQDIQDYGNNRIEWERKEKEIDEFLSRLIK